MTLVGPYSLHIHFLTSQPTFDKSDIIEIFELAKNAFFSKNGTEWQRFDNYLSTWRAYSVPDPIVQFLHSILVEVKSDRSIFPYDRELWEKLTACVQVDDYRSYAHAFELCEFLPECDNDRVFMVVTGVVLRTFQRARTLTPSEIDPVIKTLLARQWPNTNHLLLLIEELIVTLVTHPSLPCDESLCLALKRYFEIQKNHKRMVVFVQDQVQQMHSEQVVNTLIKGLYDYCYDPNQFPSNELCLLVDCLLRFEQLKSIEHFHKLDGPALLRMAVFIETKVWYTTDDRKIYFDKDKHGQERTLFYDHGETLFLVNKGKGQIFDVRGTCKRVSAAVCIPVDKRRACRRAVQGVNLSGSAHAYQMLCEEIETIQQIQDVSAIAKCLGIFFYREEKAAIFWEYIPHNLRVLATKDISLDRQMAYAEDLICGLFSLHSKGIIHGDISESNVQIDESQKHAKFIDFGFSFNKQRQFTSKYYWPAVGYGSMLYAAPELLGYGCTTEDYERAETWSLGLLLSTIYHKGVLPPWANMVRRYHAEMLNGEITSDLKQLRHEIVPYLDALAHEKLDSPYLGLLYSMLKADPKMRPSLAECKEEIIRLRKGGLLRAISEEKKTDMCRW